MKKTILSALLLAAASLAGAQDLPKATLVLNWFPEPEAGGFYAAVADGLYKARGLDLMISRADRASTGPR